MRRKSKSAIFDFEKKHFHNLLKEEKKRARYLGVENGYTIFIPNFEITECKTTLNAKRYEIGAPVTERKTIQILLLGMLGSGKSFLINSMLNYIYGVKAEDDFRFKIIVESDELKQRESGPYRGRQDVRTTLVSSYTFHWQEWFRIPYNLTIIDTPGFSAHDGLNQFNGDICHKIRHFLSNDTVCPLKELSSVVLVIRGDQKSYERRQYEMFHYILGMVSRDMTNNISIFSTFSFKEYPELLNFFKNIRKIHFSNDIVFKLDSATLAPINVKNMTEDRKRAKLIFKQYFIDLETEGPKSINEMLEVLKKQNQYFPLLTKLVSSIRKGICTLNQLDIFGSFGETPKETLLNMMFTYQQNKQETLDYIEMAQEVLNRLKEITFCGSRLQSHIDIIQALVKSILEETSYSPKLKPRNDYFFLEHVRIMAQVLRNENECNRKEADRPLKLMCDIETQIVNGDYLLDQEEKNNVHEPIVFFP